LLFIPVGNLFLPLPYLPLPYLLFIPEGNLLLPLPYLPLLYLLFIPEGNLLCRCPICRCSICFSFPKGICFAVALFAVALFAFHSRRESALPLPYLPLLYLLFIPEGNLLLPFCLSFPKAPFVCHSRRESAFASVLSPAILSSAQNPILSLHLRVKASSTPEGARSGASTAPIPRTCSKCDFSGSKATGST
jgi:hypothetical protein